MAAINPQRQRTIVYIDGFNFYYGALKHTQYKWLNLERYFSLLRPDDDIQAIKYFTAEVSGAPRLRQQAYLRALATLPRVTIILGKFKNKTVHCNEPSCSHSGNRYFETAEENEQT